MSLPAGNTHIPLAITTVYVQSIGSMLEAEAARIAQLLQSAPKLPIRRGDKPGRNRNLHSSVPHQASLAEVAVAFHAMHSCGRLLSVSTHSHVHVRARITQR